MKIIGSTFNQTYENYKAHFVNQYGAAKFEKIHSVVTNSDKVKRVLAWSRANHDFPGGQDFGIAINGIFYFVLKNNEFIAMGILIAIQYWNDTVNAYMHLCPDERVNDIAINQLRQHCLSLVIRG